MAVGLAGVMTAVLLAGCATKATPENLLRDMEKNSDEVESTLMNFKMNMAMSDDSDDVNFGMDMDLEATMEPEASHGKGTVSMNMMGMNFDVPTEMYSVIEDDEYVTYTPLSSTYPPSVYR